MINFRTTCVAQVLTLESCQQCHQRVRMCLLLFLLSPGIAVGLICGFGDRLEAVTTTLALPNTSVAQHHHKITRQKMNKSCYLLLSFQLTPSIL